MPCTSVNITELRSRLSTYLTRVRGGEEILIRDRNLAIAKMVPLANTDDFDEETLELATQGVVRLPDKDLDLKSFFAMPAPHIPLARLRAAIDAEREED
ncbi:MAG: type II toxin-antitoxin system Phd/YefM family antitoxin [Acidobacteriia bacterium]|nr:type II toxin-antitoxin system Phd/YefM family antitoxin [Terriglobia bacterium]